MDGSAEMIKVLNEKRPGVYKDLAELFLGKPETFPKKYHG
jgi:hypothetical protein